MKKAHNRITMMDCPAKTSVTEYFWLKIKKRQQSVDDITFIEQLYDENNSIWSRFGCETIENVYKSFCKGMLQYEELKDIYHEILVCNKCNKIFFITDIFKTVYL